MNGSPFVLGLTLGVLTTVVATWSLGGTDAPPAPAYNLPGAAAVTPAGAVAPATAEVKSTVKDVTSPMVAPSRITAAPFWKPDPTMPKV